MDPMWRLFDYACDKFYYVKYGNEYKLNFIKGLLLDCGPCYVFLTECGLYIIDMKEIYGMHPIPMPQDLSDNFKKVIETYLKERTEQDEKDDNDA